MEYNWKDINNHTPIAYLSGHWDGLKSDFMLVATEKGNIYIACVYMGFLDGFHFIDWYLKDDYELIEKVTHFMDLPEHPYYVNI